MPRVPKWVNDYVLPRPMTLEEEFSLDFVTKFVRFRKIPLRFLLNVTILALLLVFVQQVQLPEDAYITACRYGISSLLVDPEDNTDSSLTTQLNTASDFISFVEDMITGYYEAPSSSSGVYMHFANSSSDFTPRPPTLTLHYRKYYYAEEDSTTLTRTFELLEDNPLGPLANATELLPRREDCMPETNQAGAHFIPCRNSSLSDFLDRLLYARIDMQLRGVTFSPQARESSVVRWRISTLFTFEAHNSIINAVSEFYYRASQRVDTFPVVVCAALLPLVLLDIMMRMFFFLKYYNFKEMNTSVIAENRFLVARGWTIIGLVGEIITMVFIILAFVQHFSDDVNLVLLSWKRLLLGLAAFFNCILLLSHFHSFPRFYLMAQAMTTALPHLGMYLVGIFPIFFGYSMCGVAVFGGMSDNFGSVWQSMRTLYCMLNGDSLLDIYNTTNQSNFVVLRWFLYLFMLTFLLVFIGNILNIALAIVQDSYTHVCEVQQLEEAVRQKRPNARKTHVKRLRVPMRADEARELAKRISEAVSSESD